LNKALKATNEIKMADPSGTRYTGVAVKLSGIVNIARDRGEIDHYEILTYGSGVPMPIRGGEIDGIQFSYQTNILIEGTTTSENGHKLNGSTGYGFASEAGSYNNGIVFRNNTSTYNYRKGLDIHDGDRILIENNVSYGDRLLGISVYNRNFKMENVIIRNNIITQDKTNRLAKDDLKVDGKFTHGHDYLQYEAIHLQTNEKSQDLSEMGSVGYFEISNNRIQNLDSSGRTATNQDYNTNAILVRMQEPYLNYVLNIKNNQITGHSANDILKMITEGRKQVHMEWLYLFFANAIYEAGFSFYIFTFLLAIAAITIKYKAFTEHAIYPAFAMLLFMYPTLLVSDGGQMRQGMAMAIILFSFRYIKELDGYSKFFCLIILLSGIGIYSYGSALNYFLKFYEKVSSDTIGTFVMCSSLLAFFGTAFLLGKLLKKFKEKSIYKFLIFVGIILMAIILFRVKFGVTPYLLMAFYTMTYEIVRSLGNTIIAQRYKENQGKILGVASAVGSLGTAIGSLLSGYLLNFNPFLPFVVNIIVMFFVLVLILVKKLFIFLMKRRNIYITLISIPTFLLLTLLVLTYLVATSGSLSIFLTSFFLIFNFIAPIFICRLLPEIAKTVAL